MIHAKRELELREISYFEARLMRVREKIVPGFFPCAGLIAAFELQNQGVTAHLLEANGYWGGRPKKRNIVFPNRITKGEVFVEWKSFRY